METLTKRIALWHAQPDSAVLAELASHPDGLGQEEVERRLQVAGPNLLPREGGAGITALLWRQLRSPLILVLLGAAALALAMGKTTDGMVVLAVVMLNVLIGFMQEYRAGKAIAALVDLVPHVAHVIREGIRQTVPAVALVPGDIVLLQAGDKVPADLRLLSLRGLFIDEAMLTGESVPAYKAVEAVAADVPLGDRHSMAYSGTLVASGTGTGVVVSTGMATELGRISQLLKATQEVETPLTRQMETVSKGLTIGITVVALLLLGISLLRGDGLVDAVLAAITLAVAAIPEGLPAIITIALAIGVQRMALRRAIIRKLPAVETLGSTTVICTDKTGTLTRGEMTVQVLWTPDSGRFEVSGVGYAPEGRLIWQEQPVCRLPSAIEALLMAGVLCNDAHLYQSNGAWHITGNPTEGALVVAAEKLGLRAEPLRQRQSRLDVAPFASERQYMATLNAAEQEPIVYLKGAPEVVVPRCSMPARHGLDASFVLEQADRLAAEGLRVLALASKPVARRRTELTETDLEGGFTLLGFQAMIDPPRMEAADAVRACQEASIEVKMITGDHRATAQVVARQLGLVVEPDAVFTGAELESMDEVTLREAARHGCVFARVAPEHKLRLVRVLQELGHVVAMTGDGVNDAPALKQADIGVAMGVTGTAVSKEAADMVLADDNFASIRAAVEEGRRVYDNLVKSLAFVLPTNIGEALIILLAVLFFPIAGGVLLMPMLPVQILWINLVATVALALPLAFEAMEPNLMHRPPRDPSEPILGRFVLVRTGLVALLMTVAAIGLFLYDYHAQLAAGVGASLALARAQTVTVTTVILFQCFYLLQCRSLRDSALQIGLWTNPWVYVGIGVLLVLHTGFVYLPFMHRLFGSAPLDAAAWLRAIGAALVVLPVIYAEKEWHKRHAWRAPRRLAATPILLHHLSSTRKLSRSRLM